MGILAMLCGLVSMVGGLISFVFGVMLLIKIFTKSGPLWGLGSIFVPFVSLYWLYLNWEDGKDLFFKGLGGTAISIVGSVGAGVFAAMASN
jgi:hypothetical protein